MQSKKHEPAGVQWHGLYRPAVAIFNLQPGKSVVVGKVRKDPVRLLAFQVVRMAGQMPQHRVELLTAGDVKHAPGVVGPNAQAPASRVKAAQRRSLGGT